MIVTLRQVLYLIYMRHSLQRGVCVDLVAAVLRGIRTNFFKKRLDLRGARSWAAKFALL